METEEKEEVAKNKGGRPPKRDQQPRKKQPPKTKRYPAKARAVKKLHKDPIFRARNQMARERARAAQQANGPSRLGVPDGWTRGKADMQRVYDGIRADLLIDRMKAEGMVDETKPGDFEIVIVQIGEKNVEVKVPKTEAGMAEAALREACISALSPLTYSKDKLGWCRTVLEYTKKKPATDSNVNLNSEEWLEAALKDNADSGNGTAEGGAS